MSTSSAGSIPARGPGLEVSVVVPVYTGGRNFVQVLDALAALQPPPLEVIVVADGCVDGSDQEARARGFKVVSIDGPSGPARARNQGAAQARGDILFFTDADVVVPGDLVGRVQDFFTANPEVTGLIGSYDDQPGDPGFLSQYRNLLHHWVHQNSPDRTLNFWGACGAIGRRDFLDIGGFDQSITWPCGEDIALGYTLSHAGHTIALDKSLQVKHLKRWSVWNMVKTDVRDRAMPWTELILQHGPMPNELNLNTSSRISVLCAGGLAASLMAAPWQPWALVGAGACSLGLLGFNARLYRFFWRKRGAWFMLKAIPWHWFFYFYSGVGFGLGVLRHLWSRRG